MLVHSKIKTAFAVLALLFAGAGQAQTWQKIGSPEPANGQLTWKKVGCTSGSAGTWQKVGACEPLFFLISNGAVVNYMEGTGYLDALGQTFTGTLTCDRVVNPAECGTGGFIDCGSSGDCANTWATYFNGQRVGYTVKVTGLPVDKVAQYVIVPSYTLPDGAFVPSFRVMKYEAQQHGNSLITPGGSVTSNHNRAPWTSITWQAAKAACTAAGASLISERQWLSIAHQVTSVPSNWTGGAVGSGALFSGYTNNAASGPLAASDGVAIRVTGNLAGRPELRTLTLPNGAVVWDMSGNAAEWVADEMISSKRYHGGTATWLSYNSADGALGVATNMPLAKRPPNGYNAYNGMGRYNDGNGEVLYNNVSEYPESCTGYCSDVAVFARGGWFNDRSWAGVFALSLANSKSYASFTHGFRCTR